ncbi:MAG: transcriptional regulator NrdR [Anaerolineae bacterium]|nr:transcriptional regulator NrdR [Anaerolineae bacterium]
MKCPYCMEFDSRVVDTRAAGDGIRRRRECLHCGRRFTTYEQVVAALHIVKSDGRREAYDRQKLLNSIRLACAKRPIAMADIERLVEQVEDHVYSLGKAEVRSEVIGSKVLELLKELDEVGYIRFATIYLELADLEAVRDEIDRLLKEKRA